jgi:hypothetical protein
MVTAIDADRELLLELPGASDATARLKVAARLDS